MDPYLESTYWMAFHSQLIAEIARQLAPKLRPRYLALTSERFVLDYPEDVAVATSSIYPDVGLAEGRSPSPLHPKEGVGTAPLRLPTVIPSRVPHVTVEIRDTQNRQLVTAIEVLSPTNKHGDGFEEYLSKRERLLLSTAHLMEIDLLRQGQRVPMQKPLPSVPYFVFLTRNENKPITEVWPILLQDSLPPVPVPLLPGDADVLVNLQQALTTVYDLFAYDLAIDYSKPPRAPLPPEAAAWADERIRHFRRQP
jgi:hypothetical protein